MQEHTVLLRAYARVQERCSRLVAEQAARIAELESQLVRLRGALVQRDSAVALAREEVAARAAARGLTLPQRVLGLLAPGRWRRAAPAAAAASAVPSDLREKAVLCIGPEGEAAGLARQLVEIAGGRFLQHAPDVLEQADEAAFEASLREADLVICQTGCVSHGNWWRVQDHCRRTGKPCVMVGAAEQPLQFVRRAQEGVAPGP